MVRDLMASGADLTVVAFARSQRKAFDVLFDDVDDDGGGGGGRAGRAAVRRSRRRGPKLEVVVGDLIAREEVFGYDENSDRDDNDDDNDEQGFNSRLDSVRRFFGNVTAEELRAQADGGGGFDPDEALRDAVKDCTAVVSCVGTVRPTNVWTDYVRAPWRIFVSDASKWCRDSRHPYYVNYLTTRKVLDIAEREQKRREDEVEEYEKVEEEMVEEALRRGLVYEREEAEHERGVGVDRIKIVRISDLAVTSKPWGVVPVLVNMARSLVFRYQDRSEQILQESTVLDTIILRPGDLVNEERNETTTSIQVDSSGVLPYPAIVSRTDVAAVAASAALTRPDGTHPALGENRVFRVDLSGKAVKKRRRKIAHLDDGVDDADDDGGEAAGGVGGATNARRKRRKGAATSRTWAVRWAGEHLEQGRKRDGRPDAQSCVDRCMEDEARRAKRRRRLTRVRDEEHPVRRAVHEATGRLRRRRPKPYGVFVALPVYGLMAAAAAAALRAVPGTGGAVGLVAGVLRAATRAMP